MREGRSILKRIRVLASLAAGCAALTWSASARAQDESSFPSTLPPTLAAESAAPYAGPNRVLLGVGVTSFALAYAPAVVVAAESSLTEDKALYAPAAGPWVDLASRPDCGTRVSCDLEAVDRVLLATDGVFQGLGALAGLAGFLFPEHGAKLVVADGAKPNLHVTPTRLGGRGYGLVAFGDF
jgi:hypothetical protein